MALAIDGVVHYRPTFGASSTATLPGLTTANAGDIIILNIANINVGINSVSGASIGSFTKIGTSSGGTPPLMEAWACYASSALSGEVVTVQMNNAYDPIFDLFGVSGSNQTSLTGAFETFIQNENGAFGGTLPQNFTTVNANAMIIGTAFHGFGGVAATPGTGFSFVYTPVDALMSIYKVRSSTGTDSISADQDSLAAGMMGYAVIETSGGGGPAAKLNTGLHHIEAGSPMGKKTNGLLHPIRHGIVGWRKGLILPRRVIHTDKRAA